MIPDDPLIRYAEKNGFAPWNVPQEPRCPVCGGECEYVYKDIHGVIVGCDECLSEYAACKEDECFQEDDE